MTISEGRRGFALADDDEEHPLGPLDSSVPRGFLLSQARRSGEPPVSDCETRWFPRTCRAHSMLIPQATRGHDGGGRNGPQAAAFLGTRPQAVASQCRASRAASHRSRSCGVRLSGSGRSRAPQLFFRHWVIRSGTLPAGGPEAHHICGTHPALIPRGHAGHPHRGAQREGDPRSPCRGPMGPGTETAQGPHVGGPSRAHIRGRAPLFGRAIFASR